MAVNLTKMKATFLFLTLLCVRAEGNIEAKCIVEDRKNLRCIFPENINTTRKDFTVYFYPDSGGEEPLLDCAWLHENLDCIVQEGFACKDAVSENAIISVPTRFANRTGSYRCKTDSYALTPCRFKSQEEGEYVTCEARTLSEGCHLTVNCTFAVDVDIFSIEINKTVVATYSKSSCQASDLCQQLAGHRQDIFTVKLDNPDCREGEYRCKAVHPTPILEARVCTVSKSPPTESPPVAGLAVILPVVLGTTMATAVVFVLLIIWRRRKSKVTKNAFDERAQGEHLIIDPVRSVCGSAEMP